MPRVASATITSKVINNSAILPHSLRPSLINIILRTLRTKYFTYTFVRHPYSRFYSSYKWSLRNFDKKLYPLDVKQKSAVSFFNNMESFCENLNDILCDIKKNFPIHFFPQSDYITTKNDIIIVDYVGKYENIEHDFGVIAEQLNIDCEFKFGANQKNPYKTKQQNEIRNILPENVRRQLDIIYQKDFELFNYEKY